MTPLLRWALLASGPLNLLGAILFSPPGRPLRVLVGFPEGTPFHQWTIACWVLAFGVAYAIAGVTGRVDCSVLVLGAWGKAVFFGLLARAALVGEVPVFTALSALPDLLLAGIFLHAWRTMPVDRPPH